MGLEHYEIEAKGRGVHTPRPMAPMMTMVRMSSHVCLSHCPNVGRRAIEYGSWTRRSRRLRFQRRPLLPAAWPFVTPSTGASAWWWCPVARVLREKRPMMVVSEGDGARVSDDAGCGYRDDGVRDGWSNDAATQHQARIASLYTYHGRHIECR